MCDTLVYTSKNYTLFAKNSDREPGEIQHTCYVPAVTADESESVKATYIEIPQVPDRYAVVLSRPFWMWGAEMGVNEQGLVIGNEAVFSKRVRKSGEALLGMDLLRLALERSSNAREAIQCIADLLQAHGQGGAAGYRDKSFRYDSSFILADPTESWVMETAGKEWVANKVERFYAISNALSLRENYSLHSRGFDSAGVKAPDFAAQFDTRFMRTMGCAYTRRGQSIAALSKLEESGKQDNLPTVMMHLRSHFDPALPIRNGSNRDICMHAASILRPSQTCGSLIVSLSPNNTPVLWLTGTSAPCMSLFQGIEFPTSGGALPALFYEAKESSQSHWVRFEHVHRKALLDDGFRRVLLRDRDETQGEILRLAELGDLLAGQRLAEDWFQRWYELAIAKTTMYSWYKPYDRYWKKRNMADRIS